MSDSSALYSSGDFETFAVGAPPASNIDLINGATGRRRPCRRIRVAGAGDLALTSAAGKTVVHPALAAGEVIDVQANTILSAGTTVAAGITVYW
jgi:uncharacterized protein (AIM24 family)